MLEHVIAVAFRNLDAIVRVSCCSHERLPNLSFQKSACYLYEVFLGPLCATTTLEKINLTFWICVFLTPFEFFKVVELEISCLGSRSINPELEYVSSYDTFHFWKSMYSQGGYMRFRPSPNFLPHYELFQGSSKQGLLAKSKTLY